MGFGRRRRFDRPDRIDARRRQAGGAVCHAPGGAASPEDADGKSVVSGKTVTGFTNSEEAAVGLTDVVPFLVEDMLTGNGGNYSQGGDWQPHVVADGLLITGQNPASSAPAAQALLVALGLV